MPPTTPTAAPTASPIPISRSANCAQCPGVSRLAPAAASATSAVTTGRTMPSLSPLSTFSTWRIRFGICRLVATALPRAASVGARIAPIRKPSAIEMSGTSHDAARPPKTIVSGSPMPRSRPGISRNWRRMIPMSTRVASAKRTSTRVASARSRTPDCSNPMSTRAKPSGPITQPTTTKVIGAVIDHASRRRDRRA